MKRQWHSFSAGERVVALTIALVLDAVAFATVLRPHHAYTTHRLLVVLAIGLGVALGANMIAGAATAVGRLRLRSLWEATTTLSTLGIVLGLFIIAAVGSRVIPALPSGASRVAVSSPAVRADFQRWQAIVVPIAVRWTNAMRTDQVFSHPVSTVGLSELRRAVERSRRTIEELSRSLAGSAPRLPQRPALRRLTNELATGLAVSERAQAIYALAIASAANTGVSRNGRASRIRSLIGRGNAELTQSRATMYAFSLHANKLGGSLFVEKP